MQPGASRGDAWSAAQQLAARGDFTAAAHALYGRYGFAQLPEPQRWMYLRDSP